MSLPSLLIHCVDTAPPSQEFWFRYYYDSDFNLLSRVDRDIEAELDRLSPAQLIRLRSKYDPPVNVDPNAGNLESTFSTTVSVFDRLTITDFRVTWLINSLPSGSRDHACGRPAGEGQVDEWPGRL